MSWTAGRASASDGGRPTRRAARWCGACFEKTKGENPLTEEMMANALSLNKIGASIKKEPT